jgi:hypothetical protein
MARSYEEPHLFLHRSWTGQSVYPVALRIGPTRAEVEVALLSVDITEPARFDLDYQARFLDSLVSNLCSDRQSPFQYLRTKRN